MESNFLDWALKKGLKQRTIDKLTQEDLNDFRALKLLDIPACSKHLGLSLGQAAILANAVKSMLEKDDNETKRDRNNADKVALPRVKTLTNEQTDYEYINLMEDRNNADKVALPRVKTLTNEQTDYEYINLMEDRNNADKVALPRVKTLTNEQTDYEYINLMEDRNNADKVALPRVKTLTNEQTDYEYINLMEDRNNADKVALPRVKTLTNEQTDYEYINLMEGSRLSPLEQNVSIAKANSPSGQGFSCSKFPMSQNNLVRSLAIGKTSVDRRKISTESGQTVRPEENIESMTIGNQSYEIMHPIKNTQKQSPLLRRRERQLDGNTSTCVLGVADRELVGRSEGNGEPYGEINVKYHIVPEDTKVQLITELSTEHITNAPCVPVRIVLLVDRSGSMLHFLGESRRHRKITQVKRFAMQLIQNLDTGDEAGIVTFGADADIFYPLTEITDDSRKKMLSDIEKLDSGRMCSETNLSSGLRVALKVFNDAIKNPDELLNRKNSIFIFSDGEINAGTTDPDALVHEVRHNIRQMAPSLDNSTNQWVTISVVTTGSAVSEAAYLLSKTCSSDAYYNMDKAVNDPTAELFLPVLLRKSAVAWNVSFLIQTFNGVHFVDEECSSNYKIRLRRTTQSKTLINAEKAYFLYDFPAGKRRQIGITVDISNMVLAIDDKTNDRKVFQIRLEYTGSGGERRQVEKCIYQLQIEKSNEDALCASVKHKVQLATNEILRKAADYVRDGDQRASAVLLDGKTDIQRICNRFGQIARSNTDKHNVYGYAASVVHNMEELMKTLEGHLENKGPAWNRIKAVSSAITREAPTVSETVKHSDILCPLPVIFEAASTGFLDPMRKLTEKRSAMDRESEADLEALLEDMARRLR